MGENVMDKDATGTTDNDNSKPRRANTSPGVSEAVGVYGELTLTQTRDGKVIKKVTLENLVTNSGLEYFSKLLITPSERGVNYMQIGTGGTEWIWVPSIDLKNPDAGRSVEVLRDPQSTNTALYEYYAESNIGDFRKSTRVRTGVIPTKEDPKCIPYTAIAVFAYTFDFTESARISEAGLFTGARATSSAIMVSHRTFWHFNVVADDFLEIVWELGFSRDPRI